MSRKKKISLVIGDNDSVLISTNGKTYEEIEISYDSVLQLSEILAKQNVTLNICDSFRTLMYLVKNGFSIKNNINCVDVLLHLHGQGQLDYEPEQLVLKLYPYVGNESSLYNDEVKTLLCLAESLNLGIQIDKKLLEEAVKDSLTPQESGNLQNILKSLERLSCTYIVRTEYTTLTSTGRIYSRNPNIQNVPRKFQNIFTPPHNHDIISLDYSQIELRMAAYFSEDDVLCNAFKSNQDIHQITADALGVDRDIGKTINFAILYGASPKAIEQHVNKDGKKIIDSFFSFYKGLAELKRGLERSGSAIRSLNGRVAEFSEKEKYKALNFLIQSSAADVFKRAIRETHELLRNYRSRMAFVVHDEIVFYIHKEEGVLIDKLIDTMEFEYDGICMSVNFNKWECK